MKDSTWYVIIVLTSLSGITVLVHPVFKTKYALLLNPILWLGAIAFIFSIVLIVRLVRKKF